MSSTGQTDFVNLQVALLQALTYSGVGMGSPQTAPVVTGKPFVNYARVTEVRVGNVPDTQRRRRRSLPETYVSASL